MAGLLVLFIDFFFFILVWIQCPSITQFKPGDPNIAFLKMTTGCWFLIQIKFHFRKSDYTKNSLNSWVFFVFSQWMEGQIDFFLNVWIVRKCFFTSGPMEDP